MSLERIPLTRSPTVGRVISEGEGSQNLPKNLFVEEDVRKPIVSRTMWVGYCRPPSQEGSQDASQDAKSDSVPSNSVGLHNLISVLKGESSAHSEENSGKVPSTSSPDLWTKKGRQNFLPRHLSRKATGRESVESITSSLPCGRHDVGSLDRWQDDTTLPAKESLENFQPIFSEVSPEPILKGRNQKPQEKGFSSSNMSEEDKVIFKGLITTEQRLLEIYSNSAPPQPEEPLSIQGVPANEVRTSVNSTGSACSSGKVALDGNPPETSRPNMDDVYGQEEASLKAVDDLMSENTTLRAEKRFKENENKELQKKLEASKAKEKHLGQKAADMEERLRQMDGQLRTLQEEAAEMQSSLRQAEQNLKDSQSKEEASRSQHEAEFSRQRENFEQRICTLEESLQSVRTESESQQEMIARRAEELKEKDCFIKKLTEELEASKKQGRSPEDEAEIASLREKLAQNSNSNYPPTGSSSGGVSSERVKELETQNGKLKNTVKLLEFRVKNAEEQERNYNTILKSLEEKRRELSQKEEEMVILKRMWDKNDLVRRAESAEKQVEALNLRVLETEGKLLSEGKLKEELEGKISALVEEKGAMEFESRKLQKELVEAHATATELSDKLRAEQERLLELTNSVESSKEKRAPSGGEMDEMALMKLAKGNGKITLETDLFGGKNAKAQDNGIGIEFPAQLALKRKNFFGKKEKKQPLMM